MDLLTKNLELVKQLSGEEKLNFLNQINSIVYEIILIEISGDFKVYIFIIKVAQQIPTRILHKCSKVVYR